MCYDTVRMKLKHLFDRRQPEPHPLYGAIVAAARQPSLYLTCRIADTLDQRLSLLTLYLALAVDRLNATNPIEIQEVVELFFADVEANLREVGVSDVAIPRHMREVEARYVNLVRELKSVMRQSPPAEPAQLVPLTKQFVQAGEPERLAQVIYSTWGRLAALPPQPILAGEGFAHEESH